MIVKWTDTNQFEQSDVDLKAIGANVFAVTAASLLDQVPTTFVALKIEFLTQSSYNR